jgi:integrase
MANKAGRWRFGKVRRLPSGRFQIRYPGPDGRVRTGDDTYASHTFAEQGAGTEKAPERPTLTVSQVYDLAGEMPDRLFALVLLTTFASLRYGEVTALQRRDLDLEERTVRVRRAFVRRPSGELVEDPPKSRAGVRSVAIPASLVPELRRHLEEFVPDEPDALVFTGPKGGLLKRNNLNGLSGWKAAVARIGVPDLHFYDLRYTGNTWAAAGGVSTRDTRAGGDPL